MEKKTFLDNETWRYFWHPVCSVAELDASDKGRGALLKTTLLGVELVVAKTSSGVVAFNNRCPHRSAKLSLGWVKDDAIQCPYHGWTYGAKDGMCVAIPAAPNGPIPPNAQATKYDCEVRYDLVWVRLDGSADTSIPGHLVFDDPEFKCVLGPSYIWKTHSARRVENYVDLAHFPFVHPETLGSSGFNTFLAPNIDFENEGTLRFRYVPAEGSRKAVDSKGNLAALAFSDYRIRAPFGVTVDLTLENGSRTVLWVWATPIDDENFLEIGWLIESEEMKFDQAMIEKLHFGMMDDRPFAERQMAPGDYDAQVSQGPIHNHGREHLGVSDRGVTMFRRMLRAGIDDVRNGKDPKGLNRAEGEVIATHTQNAVFKLGEPGASETLKDQLRNAGRRVAAGEFRC